MSDVAVKLKWEGDLRFSGYNAGGIKTEIDGDHKSAASPVDILVEAIGACSAVDVVLILQKMRTPATRLEISIDADRHSPEPRYLTGLRLLFDIWGSDIKPEKAARTIQLSLVKYCSVFNSLRPDIITEASFRIHEPAVEGSGEYQSVSLNEAVKE